MSNNNDPPLWMYLAIIVLATAITFLGMRWWNATTVTVTLKDVEPGRRCAVATSNDGVAIDCWQVTP